MFSENRIEIRAFTTILERKQFWRHSAPLRSPTGEGDPEVTKSVRIWAGCEFSGCSRTVEVIAGENRTKIGVFRRKLHKDQIVLHAVLLASCQGRHRNLKKLNFHDSGCEWYRETRKIRQNSKVKTAFHSVENWRNGERKTFECQTSSEKSIQKFFRFSGQRWCRSTRN